MTANWAYSFIFRSLAVTLFCVIYILGAAPSASADSVTYTYTGNQLTSCNQAYAGTCANVTASFTLAAPLGDNLNADNVAPSVTAFSISDGSGVTLDLSTPGLFGFLFVDTDSSGNITAWSIQGGACNDPSCSTSNFVITESGLVLGTPVGFALDFATNAYPNGNPCITIGTFDATACSLINTAYVFNDAGTWTVTTPEPSSVLLLGVGLVALMALMYCSRIRMGHSAQAA